MNWRRANTLEELKKVGPFRSVKAEVKRNIEASKLPAGLNLHCSAAGWAKLWEVIVVFKRLEPAIIGNPISEPPPQTKDPYFKSKEARFIFSLLELDGEDRNRQLGLNEKHYRSKDEAKTWMRDIAREIHPDKNSDPRAEIATQKLNELYQILTSI